MATFPATIKEYLIVPRAASETPMTEDDVDAMIAPLYERGLIARDQAWRAYEATLGELRRNLLQQAQFISSFGHLTSQAMAAAQEAENVLRQSMPEPPPVPPVYDDADADFERRIAWMRQNTPRGAQ